MMNQDKYPPKLLALVVDSHQKNKKDKTKIVVVHDSERLGMLYAKSLFLRGFANMHLLRGTVKEFAQSYPDLIEGEKADVITKEASRSKLTKRKGSLQ